MSNSAVYPHVDHVGSSDGWDLAAREETLDARRPTPNEFEGWGLCKVPEGGKTRVAGVFTLTRSPVEGRSARL